MGLADLFKNILGYPLLGEVQKNIVDDLIDVPKWKINVDYVQKNVFRWDLLIGAEDDNPETRHLAQDVNPVFAKIMHNMDSQLAGAYPEAIVSQILGDGNPEYLCFLAAYPDVFDYFHPIVVALKEDEIPEGIKDYTKVFRQFVEGGGDEINYLSFLIYLKNYYRDVLKKQFQLARFN